MESVFENMTKVQRIKLLKGVEQSVMGMWGAENDFRRFNIGNGSSVLVKVKKTVNGNISITTKISNPKCKAVETAQVIFEPCKIGIKQLYAHWGEELAGRTAELIVDYELNKIEV